MNGMIYLGLGSKSNSDAPMKKWYRVDPATNSWTSLTDFPVMNRGAGHAVIGDKLWIGGGTYSDKVYEFNEAGNGSWRTASIVNGLVGSCKSFTLNGDFYFGLGVTNAGTFFNKLIRVDAAGNSSHTADFPGGLASLGTAFSYRGKAYVLAHLNGLLYEYTAGPNGGSWRRASDDTPAEIEIVHVINDKLYLIDRYENVFEYTPDFLQP